MIENNKNLDTLTDPKSEDPINTELLENTITFGKDGKPILTFKSNGEIHLKGKLIGNDKETVDSLRKFLRHPLFYNKIE